MCEVYEFPVKKELPENLKDELQRLAKDYVQLMDKALTMFEEGGPTDEELNKFMEEVMRIYTEAIVHAVDEI